MTLEPRQSGAQQEDAALSVIIPVHNSVVTLDACLTSLRLYAGRDVEVIVVDDGCTDESIRVASSFGAKLVRTGTKSGPARARNLGAAAARGSILLFLDADVCVRADTMRRIRNRFGADAELAAVIGSYDDAPADPGFVSQYRNLLHHYVHQNGQSSASTFWAGCGAIRRQVFEEFGGFDAIYNHASIEDIELGYRLTSRGRKILLDRDIQVTHLKRWRLWRMLKTDIARRGIPWMKIILRDRRMPDDLNLRASQRLSVMLAYVGVLFSTVGIAGLLWPRPAHVALWSLYAGLFAWMSLLALNVQFYRFLTRKRGLIFGFGAIPLHFAYFLCNGISFLAGVVMYFSYATKRPLTACAAQYEER